MCGRKPPWKGNYLPDNYICILYLLTTSSISDKHPIYIAFVQKMFLKHAVKTYLYIISFVHNTCTTRIFCQYGSDSYKTCVGLLKYLNDTTLPQPTRRQ